MWSWGKINPTIWHDPSKLLTNFQNCIIIIAEKNVTENLNTIFKQNVAKQEVLYHLPSMNNLMGKWLGTAQWGWRS